MCGIAGCVGPLANAGLLERMRDALRHRGPDGEGVWIDTAFSVGLAHTRLAILDVSDAGHQPMVMSDGSAVIAYNGEVYNYMDLAGRLEGAGLVSESDTEVVLRWLSSKGPSGLPALRGMFALALVDLHARRVLLARDPNGIKPLYVARVGESILFASEVRALLASGAIPRRADPIAIHDYVAYGFVLEPRTIVEGIACLPPGGWLSLSIDGGLEKSGTFEWSGHDDFEDSADPVRSAFLEAVESHLISDVPIGAFLSGGVDSSAIVAAMARSGQAARALTVSFPDEPDWDEAPAARTWARTCGIDLVEVPLTGAQIEARIDAALDAQDQPTLDAVNTFIVAAAAREGGLTVALSGLGGDELFGGYPTTRDVPRALAWRRRVGVAGPAIAGAVAAVTSTWNRRHAKIADLLSSPGDPGSVYLARRRVFSPRQIRRLGPGLGSESADQGVLVGCDHEDIREVTACLDERIYMRNLLLRDSDAMGMACGLEIRVPFLDLEFSRVARAMGPEWKDGKRRLIASLGELVPPGIADRPKRGFTLPFERWLLTSLRSTVDGSFEVLPMSFHRETVRELWDAFQRAPTVVGWARPWTLFCLARYLDAHGLA